MLAALREITDKPVSHVVNTHWHEDHIIGNLVYREAFPNVKFVGHRSTLKDLPEIGGANRKGTLQNGRGFVGMLEANLEKGESVAGGPITRATTRIDPTASNAPTAVIDTIPMRR